MIDGDGNARILDFGLAGLSEELPENELAAGTPAYMAPEQLEGKEQTAKTDIYSLGLVLYELFTSKKAFEAKTLAELLEMRRNNTAPAYHDEACLQYSCDCHPVRVLTSLTATQGKTAARKAVKVYFHHDPVNTSISRL